MFLDDNIVLRVNKNWQPIGECSIKDALIAMCSGDAFLKAAHGVDIEYNEVDGKLDFEQVKTIRAVSFDEWITLPVRPHDLVVHTSKLAIRAPTVIVANHFAKVPKKYFRATNKGIWERDKGVCQVSGKRLTKSTGNIGHLKAKAKGGKDEWENMVLMDKKLNSQQGTKTIEEMGWKLLKKPVAPNPVPISALIKVARHQDWNIFLLK